MEASFYSLSRCIYVRAHQLQWQNNLSPGWPVWGACRAWTVISGGDPLDFFFSLVAICGCCAAADKSGLLAVAVLILQALAMAVTAILGHIQVVTNMKLHDDFCARSPTNNYVLRL